MVATERALFSRLATEEPVSAVVRRIRTAIGLGVLAHGQRLPKEADLARQLGVTVFTLREALSLLREESLIVTRVGKNGGSFVVRPQDSGALAEDQLVRLTAADLRDLGDWRASLTTYAAWLAARRGSASNAERLTEYADELATTDSSETARKTLGRFHVELAAAAQSARLTRAELAMHEEFDWLVQIVLRDGEQRAAVAAAMRDLGAAVRAKDATRAWQAGAELTARAVTELTRARLQLIADRAPSGSGQRGRRSPDLAVVLRGIAHRTTALLEQVTSAVVAETPSAAADLRATAMSAAIAAQVEPRLGDFDEIVYGVGFMAEVGILGDAKYLMDWWQRAADGDFERDYSHQLDPSRDDFYEYGSQDYITRPRITRRPHAMGPYIDHGGVDDYLVTISVPVIRHDVFLGVLCADIRVASLERAISPWLATADGSCFVLNSESRVLLSNSVRFNVGDVLQTSAGLSMTDVGCFDWVIGRALDGTDRD